MGVRPDCLSDAELLRRVPDADATEIFYRRHADAVVRFAVRRCATPEDVADLVSTTFLEVLDSAAGYDAHRGPARAWVLGIARHCLADLRRSDERRAALVRRLGRAPAFTPDESDAVERMMDAATAAAPLADALNGLTDAEREVLMLVAYDELRVADAARLLGISAVTARMRLSRARRRLARTLPTDLVPASRERDHARA